MKYDEVSKVIEQEPALTPTEVKTSDEVIEKASHDESSDIAEDILKASVIPNEDITKSFF